MTFNDYVTSYIGGLTGTFAWDVNTINFIVSEALDLYGVPTEAQATDNLKAHALLRFKAIERAMVDVSGDYNYSADGSSFQRGGVFTQMKEMYKLAVHDALPYLPEGQIVVGSLDMGRDPYQRSQIGNIADTARAVDQISRELGGNT